MFLSSDGLAEFKDRECPGQQEAGDYPSPWLPRALRSLRPVGRDGTPAGKRAAGPAKGCRQMSKDPVSKTKDVRAAVDAELGFDPLVDAADITVRNIAGDVNLTGTVPSYPQYLEAAAAARRRTSGRRAADGPTTRRARRHSPATGPARRAVTPAPVRRPSVPGRQRRRPAR